MSIATFAAGAAAVMAGLVALTLWQRPLKLQREAHIRHFELPLRFAIDARLNIADGYRYAADCRALKARGDGGGDGCGGGGCGGGGE